MTNINAIEFAIEMEHDGEAYYLEQAKINKDNSLNTVFLLLAEDEKMHGQLLQNKMNEDVCTLDDSASFAKIQNVFEGLHDFKSDIWKVPNQLELYEMAQDKEKQSIDLYRGLLSTAADPKEKKLFAYLIRQEEGHFAVFEELVSLLKRANEWVESPEFGLRKEY